MGEVIVITSGKGGVGKTTVAAALVSEYWNWSVFSRKKSSCN